MNVDERRRAVERILRRNGTPRAMVQMLALEIVDSLPGEGYELVACREWSKRQDATVNG